MRQIILPALITDFACCLVIFMAFSISYGINTGLYGGIMIFGSIFFPTLGAILIFHLIKRRITTENKFVTKAIQTIILSIIFVGGLFIWAIIDVILFSYDFSYLTADNIWKDFDSQFRGFLPITFLEALIIPFIYEKLNKPNFDSNAKLKQTTPP